MRPYSAYDWPEDASYYVERDGSYVTVYRVDARGVYRRVSDDAGFYYSGYHTSKEFFERVEPKSIPRAEALALCAIDFPPHSAPPATVINLTIDGSVRHIVIDTQTPGKVVIDCGAVEHRAVFPVGEMRK